MSKVVPEDWSKEDEIAQVMMGKPHVVILGAGTSRAACPQGDVNGNLLPLMKDFVEVLHLSDLFGRAVIEYDARNFEDIYDQIYRDEQYVEIRHELEGVVYGYFDSLRLPDEPTIYDHLVLSLREKDVIATFNWDPFLVQAYRRSEGMLPLKLGL